MRYTVHALERMNQRGVTRADVTTVVVAANYTGIHPIHGTRQYEGLTRGYLLRVALDPLQDVVVSVMWLN